jgi:hypothetical protein
MVFGLRGAALLVIWLVASLIVAAIFGLGVYGLFGFAFALGITLMPFGVIAAVIFGLQTRHTQPLDDDDAILRREVEREERRARKRSDDLDIMREHFAAEMERRLKRDGYYIPPLRKLK